MKYLNRKQLEELRSFDSPTIANAIERFDLRPRSEGFMGPEIGQILPYDKPLLGYACTAKISAAQPPNEQQKRLLIEYYAHVKNTPEPTVAVIEDLDRNPLGSFWGEVQSTTHKALGCEGVITSGGVRDLDEVQALGFYYFAGCVLVSHAYVHIEEFACPVTVGGLTVRPGDLLHADKHGVVLIPQEIAEQLAEACRAAQYAEQPVIQGCSSSFGKDLDLEDLKRWREEMARRRTGG